MAVVGEANIIVRAITTGFDNDLRRQLRALGGNVGPQGRRAGESIGDAFQRGFSLGAGNIFSNIASGLRELVPDAEAARLQFRSLVRIGYTLGTAITTLIGGISSLVGGLVILISALGRAAPAAAGLVSAFVQMRVAIGFVTFALRGIGQAVGAATQQNQGLGKSIAEIREEFQQLQFQAEEAALSESRAALNLENALENLRRTADLPPNSAARREAKLAYEEAELAYRRAKDRTQDLNEEVAKGPEALNQAGGSDPYAGLTESQKKFAQFLVGLRPKLDVLREAVASGFLPLLETQIQSLVDLYFPDLEDQLKKVGIALGQGSGNLFDNFLEESTKAEVDLFFENLTKNIPLIGEILGELGEVLLKVFNDADGIGTQFLTWVRDTLVQWNEELDRNGLGNFFQDAYDTGSRLFGIIGNIFNGLGDFFEILDRSGALDVILSFFEESTSGFASLIDDSGVVSIRGMELGTVFKGLADNFAPVMTLLKQIFDIFLELGANPAVKEAFEKLTEPGNAQNWENIFTAMVEAGPALADLAVTFGEIFAGFADSEAPTAFFETINALISPFADWISDPANKEIVDTIGKIFAQLTAVTFVLGLLKFGFKVAFGNIIAFFGGLGKFFGKGGFFSQAFGKEGVLAKFFGKGGTASKVGTVVKGAFGELKTWAGTAISYAKNVLITFGTRVGTFLKPVIGYFANMWNLFKVYAITGLKNVLTGLGTFVTNFMIRILGALGRVVGIALRFLGGPWGILITTLVSGLVWFFTQTEAGKKIFSDFWEFIKGGWDRLVEKFKLFADFFKDLFNDPVATILQVFVAFVNKILSLLEGLVNMFVDGANTFINGILTIANKVPGVNLPLNIIPKANFGTVSMPQLAKGGIVMPSAGGTIARVAEAGKPERVEPLDENGLSKRDYAIINALQRNNGNGISITVNPSPGMDERELAALVSRRLAFEIKKGAI